jgi:hypothetical protein
MVMAMDPDIMAILRATAPITTVMDIPIVTETIIVDQGVDPVIGDETIGQGNRIIFDLSYRLTPAETDDKLFL